MLFWDINKPIVLHYRNHIHMVSSTRYCIMFEEYLKSATRRKREEMPSKVVDLHHDNFRSPKAAAIFEMIEYYNISFSLPSMHFRSDPILFPISQRFITWIRFENCKNVVHM
jgi:hypothetical protein